MKDYELWEDVCDHNHSMHMGTVYQAIFSNRTHACKMHSSAPSPELTIHGVKSKNREAETGAMSKQGPTNNREQKRGEDQDGGWILP
jgi:hypothetical protein